MPRTTGRQLARDWGVPVKHAHYGANGSWFHQLHEFPGALFDPTGYVMFETVAGYRKALGAQIKQDINVHGGIASLPGYVRIVRDGAVRLPPQAERTSYERAEAGTALFLEGGLKEVVLTRAERDQRARAACIAHYGLGCTVCNMLFRDTYGVLGEDFIHVHHLEPLASVETERTIDPIRDLRPVCPNCHAMLHQRKPPLAIEELKSLVRIGGA
jgi:hypothetical protein